MKDLFYTLAGFEDQVYVHETTQNNVTTREVRGLTVGLKHDLEAAVSNIILVFYEALTLRSLYNAVHTTLQVTTQPLFSIRCEFFSTHGENCPSTC